MTQRVKELPPGVCGQISWERLVEILRSVGEIAPNETVTHIAAANDFFRYRVTRK